MNILVYHRLQYHTAQAVKEDLLERGEPVVLKLLEDIQTLDFIEYHKEDEEVILFLLQKEDHSFFYDSEQLKTVYYTWTDRTRLRWVQPSPFRDLWFVPQTHS